MMILGAATAARNGVPSGMMLQDDYNDNGSLKSSPRGFAKRYNTFAKTAANADAFDGANYTPTGLMRLISRMGDYRYTMDDGVERSLSVRARCLLHLLISYVSAAQWADGSPVVWPSNQTLSDELGCCARQVQNLLVELEAAGLLLRHYNNRNSRLTKGGIDLRPFGAKAADIEKTIQNRLDLRARLRTDSRAMAGMKLLSPQGEMDFTQESKIQILKNPLSARDGDSSIDSGTGTVCQHPALQPIPPDWTPSADDMAWAAETRPDIQDLPPFTSKFVAKINAAGGTHRPPSVKWREWLVVEFAPVVRPAKSAKTKPKAEAAPTTIDMPAAAPDPTLAEPMEPPPVADSEAAPPPMISLQRNHGRGQALATTPLPSIPPAATAALDAARPWLSMPLYLMSESMRGPLAEAIRPGLAALEAMNSPTDPAAVQLFMETFADRRRFALPPSDQMAMDIPAISTAIPADLFPTACRHLWESFAYRRLPEPPDFTKAVEVPLGQRREAAAKLRTLLMRVQTAEPHGRRSSSTQQSPCDDQVAGVTTEEVL